MLTCYWDDRFDEYAHCTTSTSSSRSDTNIHSDVSKQLERQNDLIKSLPCFLCSVYLDYCVRRFNVLISFDWRDDIIYGWQIENYYEVP